MALYYPWQKSCDDGYECVGSSCQIERNACCSFDKGIQRLKCLLDFTFFIRFHIDNKQLTFFKGMNRSNVTLEVFWALEHLATTVSSTREHACAIVARGTWDTTTPGACHFLGCCRGWWLLGGLVQFGSRWMAERVVSHISMMARQRIIKVQLRKDSGTTNGMTVWRCQWMDGWQKVARQGCHAHHRIHQIIGAAIVAADAAERRGWWRGCSVGCHVVRLIRRKHFSIAKTTWLIRMVVLLLFKRWDHGNKAVQYAVLGITADSGSEGRCDTRRSHHVCMYVCVEIERLERRVVGKK